VVTHRPLRYDNRLLKLFINIKFKPNNNKINNNKNVNARVPQRVINNQQLDNLTAKINMLNKSMGNVGNLNLKSNLQGKQNAKKLKISDSGYTWRDDGNLITSNFSDYPDLGVSDYNILYAVASHYDWPVPKPITNQEVNGIPYVANAGYYNMSVTLTAGATTTYAVLCPCNENQNPMSCYIGDALSFAWASNTAPVITGSTTTFSNWVQIDPRVMVQGTGSTGLQQSMGGSLEVIVNVPWESTVNVGTLDPLLSPSVVGNKMPYTKITGDSSRPSFKDDFAYYRVGNDLTVTGASLFSLSSEKFVLTGGGNANQITFCTRTVPNTQEWCYSGTLISPDPGIFTGNQLIVVQIPPNQTASISVNGWASYCAEIDTTSSVGALLSQDCPLAVPYISNVKNVPNTIACTLNMGAVGRQLHSNTAVGSAPLNASVDTVKGKSLIGKVSDVFKKGLPVLKRLYMNPAVRDAISRASVTLFKKMTSAGLKKVPLMFL